VSDEAYRRKDVHAFEHNVRKYDMRAMASVAAGYPVVADEVELLAVAYRLCATKIRA
jgi:hypothetical protein